jgi:hypothetical protein
MKHFGGGRLGLLTVSWPMASLEITPGFLKVSAFGSHTFARSEVVSVEPVGRIPLYRRGVRVHHTKNDSPERIEFYMLGSRDALLAEIRAAGFPVGASARPPKRGIPLRVGAIVAAVLIWNGLFLLDLLDLTGRAPARPAIPGPFSAAALALAFAVATLAPHSALLQRLMLREGRHVGEIRGPLRLLQLILGFMMVIELAFLWST